MTLREKAKNAVSSHVMVLVCVAFLLIGAILSPNYLTVKNLTTIMRAWSITGVVAIGQCFVIISGGIDASLNGMLSCLVVFYATVDRFPFPVAVLLTILLCALFGTISGAIVAKFNIAPFIITMGMGTICEGISYLISSGKALFPQRNVETLRWIGSERLLGIPVMVYLFLIIVIIGQLLLSKTSLGLSFRAVGGNNDAAYFCGLKTKRIKIWAHVICGITCALGAVLTVARTNAADPVIGEGVMLDSLAIAVLGGTYMGGNGMGNIWGVLVGAFILGSVKNLLTLMEISSYWQYVVTGVIVIAAVVAGSVSIKKK